MHIVHSWVVFLRRLYHAKSANQSGQYSRRFTLRGFSSFFSFIPTLFGGILILAIGWFVAKLVCTIIEKLLNYARLNHVATRAGMDRYLVGPSGHYTASHGIAMLGKWFVFLIFVQAAANVLHMPQITAIINSILLYIPNVAIALIILLVGAFVARLASSAVSGAVARTGMSRANVFGLITQYAIMGFAVIAALEHLGIAVTVVNTLMMGLVGSLALALGLSFGLGGQGVASEITRNWYEQGKVAAGRLQSVPKESNERKPA